MSPNGTKRTSAFVAIKSAFDIPGVGKVTALEMVGTTENTKGEPAFDKMKAKCIAVNVETGGKKYIDGACAMTDSEGDVVFSTFDTRELDKAQPKMDCGTHFITGGTGKYKGITGTEPFACVKVDTPAGELAGSFAMDIPHNTVWEINRTDFPSKPGWQHSGPLNESPARWSGFRFRWCHPQDQQ